jgi:hypothetical protein
LASARFGHGRGLEHLGSVVVWSLRVISSVAVGGKTVVTSPSTGKASPGLGWVKLAVRSAMPACV